MSVQTEMADRNGRLWIRLHRAGAAFLVVLVATQALIAGQHLFGNWGIGLHGAFGNAAFAVAVFTAGVAFTRLGDKRLMVVGIVMVILLTSQIGLGYSARESQGAAALHIPLGVAAFGAVVYQLLAAWPGLVIGSSTGIDDASQRDGPTMTK